MYVTLVTSLILRILSQTTNERINHAHYYWMVDNDGTMCNK
jgi:hypothetical protein